MKILSLALLFFMGLGLSVSYGDTDWGGGTEITPPLVDAILKDDHDRARALINDLKTDINAATEKGITALMVATRSSESLVELLLWRSDIDVNAKDARGRTALIHAMESSFVEEIQRTIIEILLGAGAEVNVVFESDQHETSTTLRHAILYTYKGNVLLLIKAGADVSATNKKGENALMLVAEEDIGDDMGQLLLDNGADATINHQSATGDTVLIKAIQNHSMAFVKMLLGVDGIDVNQHGANGMTALMWAAEHDMTRTADALLAHKDIDINATDHRNRTAFYVAEYAGSERVAKLLRAKYWQALHNKCAALLKG